MIGPPRDRTRLPYGSAAIGFGGGAWDRTGRGRVAGNRPRDGGEDQGGMLSSAGSHAGSHGDEQSSTAPDPYEQRALTARGRELI